MGRAGRPQKGSALPEQLRELQEEGLPDGWGQYWHGERTGTDQPEGSRFIDKEALHRLEEGNLSLAEKLDVLSGIRVDTAKDQFQDEKALRSALLQDPMLQHLWLEHSQDLSDDLQYMMKKNDISFIDLQNAWQEEVTSALAQGFQRGLFRPGVEAETAEFVQSVPLSPIAALIRRGKLEPNELYDHIANGVFEIESENRERRQEFFNQDVLPYLHSIVGRYDVPDRVQEYFHYRLEGALVNALYRALVRNLGKGGSTASTASEMHSGIATSLRTNDFPGYEAFVSEPIGEEKTISGEFLRGFLERFSAKELAQEGFDMSSAAEKLGEVHDSLTGMQVLRILNGVEEGELPVSLEDQQTKERVFDAAWAEHVSSGAVSKSPLFNLMPLLREETRSELVELITEIPNIPGSKDTICGERVRQAVLHNTKAYGSSGILQWERDLIQNIREAVSNTKQSA